MLKRFFQISYKQNRVFGLDVFRSAAILTVILGHGKLIIRETSPEIAAIPLPNGVEIFFVLSGFLIGQIIFKQIGKGQFSSFKDLSLFWRFRWFRTLPNYYLVLILNIILAYFELTHYTISAYSWKFWLFLQNFAWPFYAFYPESWSLAVEEWFYLLFPAVLVLALAWSKNRYAKVISLGVILLFIVVPTLLKVQFAIDTEFANKDDWGKQVRRVVVYRLDSIMMGMLFAWIAYYFNRFFKRQRFILLVVGIVVNLLNRTFNAGLDSTFSEAFFLSINGLSMAMMLPFFAHWKEATGWLANFITYISVLSYAMYLVHFSLVLNPMYRFLDFGNNPITWWYFAGFILATFFLSHLLYKFYEKPMTDLRSKRST
jgi:peptidoglycan/LPS O-acetylase OafA/YrhL